MCRGAVCAGSAPPLVLNPVMTAVPSWEQLGTNCLEFESFVPKTGLKFSKPGRRIIFFVEFLLFFLAWESRVGHRVHYSVVCCVFSLFWKVEMVGGWWWWSGCL